MKGMEETLLSQISERVERSGQIQPMEPKPEKGQL